jgi:hypothetical protein
VFGRQESITEAESTANNLTAACNCIAEFLILLLVQISSSRKSGVLHRGWTASCPNTVRFENTSSMGGPSYLLVQIYLLNTNANSCNFTDSSSRLLPTSHSRSSSVPPWPPTPSFDSPSHTPQSPSHGAVNESLHLLLDAMPLENEGL